MAVSAEAWNGGRPSSRTGMAMLTRGKVITTADKEIIGMIHIPGDFRLELDFGALTLRRSSCGRSPSRTTIGKDKPAKAEAAAPSTHDDAGRPARPASEPAPLFPAGQLRHRHLARRGPGYALQPRHKEVRVARAVRVERRPARSHPHPRREPRGADVERTEGDPDRRRRHRQRHLAFARAAQTIRGPGGADRRVRSRRLQTWPRRLRLRCRGTALGRRRAARRGPSHALRRARNRHDRERRPYLYVRRQDRQVGSRRRPSHP